MLKDMLHSDWDRKSIIQNKLNWRKHCNHLAMRRVNENDRTLKNMIILNKIAIQWGEIMDEIDIKEIMFLVFSAGFEAGYSGKVDLAKAFNEWYDTFNKIRRE